MTDILRVPLSETTAAETTATRYPPSPSALPPMRVVLAHGAGAGQRHPFIVNVARQIAARGIEVVTFDFPYMHRGRKAPDPAGILEECFRRVIGAARQPDDDTRPVFIGGKSMGGRMATHLAAQGEDVAGVFALGYPLHPPGKPEQQRSAHLPRIAVPVLIVQGERDAFGTPAELDPVLATMTAPVTLEAVSGGDHSLAVKGQSSDRLYEWLGGLIVDWTRARAHRS